MSAVAQQRIDPSGTRSPGGYAKRKATRPPDGASRRLRRLLVLLDGGASVTAWTMALVLFAGEPGREPLGPTHLAATVAVATAASILALTAQRLYLARICTVRTVETARVARAAVLAAGMVHVLSRSLALDTSLAQTAAGACLSFGLLNMARGGYRGWLRTHRRQGRYRRPVVVVGANEEALHLYHLIADHPELGFEVMGIVGDRSQFLACGHETPWLGEVDDAVRTIHAHGGTGALVAATALPTGELNRLVRDLLCAGIHVHFSSGIHGMDHRRLRSNPLAHEPLFYLEPISLRRWQLSMKRALDVTLAAVAVAVSLPVLALIAVAVKIEDGGPVLFRQQRVGRDGRLFTVLKLRSMVVDAETRLAELMERNQRDGVLFKLTRDPRVTTVGRFLRATSLDELPQLFNVLRGDMSLVGPRPALPVEAAQFGEELRARQQVRPGITGLWQVEARDNPSFRAYQRLDVFYVENWSVSLDVAILLRTVHEVLARGWRILRRAEAGSGNTGVASLLD